MTPGSDFLRRLTPEGFAGPVRFALCVLRAGLFLWLFSGP